MQEKEAALDLTQQLSQLSEEQLQAVQLYLQSLSQEDSTDRMQKYLSFSSCGQVFGLSIDQVVQIIRIHQITPLPDYPAYIKGVVSVRGSMVPVIDLRLRLGKPEIQYDDHGCIIIVDVQGRSFGLLVEAVNSMETIPQEEICPPPQSDHKSGYLMGIAKRDPVILLLDVGCLLTAQELELLDFSSPESSSGV